MRPQPSARRPPDAPFASRRPLIKPLSSHLIAIAAVLQREPDNALVKQFVPMLFQLCVFQDEAGANESSSEEESDDDDDDDDDDGDDSDDSDDSDESDGELEPEPEPEPAATMAMSARERRVVALAAQEEAERQMAFGSGAYGMGISAEPPLRLPPKPHTPGELAAADQADNEVRFHPHFPAIPVIFP